MKIITLTLNPAFDIHCHAESFLAGRENLANITSFDAGGKGINISRALLAGETESLAFLVLGDENGESFLSALRDSGLTLRTVAVQGRIRENITIHTDGGETRLSFSGFSADDALLDRVFKELQGEIDGDTVVTFTGRVPSGISKPQLKRFLSEISALGARLVIDSKSVSLEDMIEIKPWLIKPNGEEISEYLGQSVNTFDEVKSAAERLHLEGIENVMISLGEKGAMLVCQDGTFVAAPPEIKSVSTIGAGDSTIAGFLDAHARGESAESCLSFGVAYGTAACLTSGTNPPRLEDIRKILSEVTTKKM